jgi:hypothetical protein
MGEQFASAQGSLDLKKPYPFFRFLLLGALQNFCFHFASSFIFLFSFRLA